MGFTESWHFVFWGYFEGNPWEFEVSREKSCHATKNPHLPINLDQLMFRVMRQVWFLIVGYWYISIISHVNATWPREGLFGASTQGQSHLAASWIWINPLIIGFWTSTYIIWKLFFLDDGIIRLALCSPTSRSTHMARGTYSWAKPWRGFGLQTSSDSWNANDERPQLLQTLSPSAEGLKKNHPKRRCTECGRFRAQASWLLQTFGGMLYLCIAIRIFETCLMFDILFRLVQKTFWERRSKLTWTATVPGLATVSCLTNSSPSWWRSASQPQKPRRAESSRKEKAGPRNREIRRLTSLSTGRQDWEGWVFSFWMSLEVFRHSNFEWP